MNAFVCAEGEEGRGGAKRRGGGARGGKPHPFASTHADHQRPKQPRGEHKYSLALPYILYNEYNGRLMFVKLQRQQFYLDFCPVTQQQLLYYRCFLAIQ